MRLLALLVAVLALAPVTACGGTERDDAMPAPTATTGVAEERGPAPAREAAPALVGMDLDGETISLDDFRGRPVLVNVWSSW